MDILKLLAAILHLGNISFEGDAADTVMAVRKKVQFNGRKKKEKKSANLLSKNRICEQIQSLLLFTADIKDAKAIISPGRGLFAQ